MEKRNFGVMLIGFSAHDKRLLTSTFLLSTYRSRSYALTDDSAKGAVEIVMVDADVPHAIADLQGYLTGNPTARAVLVTSRPMSGPDYYISRPIVASRVLHVLDQLTINELNFFPEMVVKDDQLGSYLHLDEVVRAERTNTKNPAVHFRALVVDDSTTVRKLMELELRISNFEIDFAATAVEAADFLAHNAYDIIFLDVMLPDGDGYQISKTIKHDKSKKHTPVIMLTGKSGAFDRVRGKLAGCDAYIAKPASHDTLQKVINQYVHVPASTAPRT